MSLKISGNIIPKSSIFHIEKQINSNLRETYKATPTTHLTTIIDNIIYNEKSHIVAIFKDYLILDDISEFLKRYYTKSESAIRLPRFFEYYETYSKIFPNYTSIYEGKFIYRNIQRKQRMIDLQEKMEMEAKMYKKSSTNQYNNKNKEQEVFVTEVYDSIMNDTNRENMGNIFGIQFINNKEMNEEDDNFYNKVNDIIDTIEKGNNKVSSVPCQGKLVLKHQSNSNIVDDNNNNNNNTNILHKKNSSNTERTLDNKNNKVHHSTVLSTKMNELKKLYHKKMHSYNLLYQKLNHSNNYINFPHSPYTERSSTSKNKTKTDSVSKKKNSNKVNNIVYIINQNPKITNHINIYSSLTNNNSVSSRNKNNMINSSSKNKTNINIRQLLLSSKNKTKNPSPNKNYMLSSSMKKITSNMNSSNNNNNKSSNVSQNKKQIKKRNITSPYFNSNSLNNNNMMKTAREMNSKIAEMLKKSDNNYLNQHNLVRSSSSNHNNNNTKKDMPQKSSSIIKDDKGKISRNKRNENHEQQKSSDKRNYRFSGSTNTSTNMYNNNTTMMKKKVIKGIQIKNFKKIYNESVSSINNNYPKSQSYRSKKNK